MSERNDIAIVGIGCLFPGATDLATYWRNIAAGADGISTWDAVGLALFYPFMASRWLRLGHKDQLAIWAEHDFPLPPKLRFTRYAGQTPDRYPPGTGG